MRWWKQIQTYAALPEMRVFWFLVPLVGGLFIVSVLVVPSPWLYITSGGPVVLLAVVFATSVRLAVSNLEVKVERNQMGSIIDNLRDGVIAYDTEFRVLVFNSAAEAIFETSAGEVVGQAFSLDYASKLRSKALMQAMFPSLAPNSVNRSEQGSDLQVVDISLDSPKLELRIATTRVVDPGGALLGFVKVVRDRSREVEILKSKSAFITVAAHQLRTPTNALVWTMETLRKEEKVSDEGQKFIENGYKAALKLSKIVNDLLDVAKIEEGRFGYSFEEFGLLGFLDELLREAAAMAKEYGVRIYFEKPEEDIMVVGDKEKLSLAINNILDNAIKYNVKNGTVTLRASRAAGSPFAELQVADTGIGIKEEDIEKIFTKFFRGDNVVKIRTEGTGLGLYIVKNIIRRHGGDVKTTSEVNRGSTFTLTIPADRTVIPKKEIVFD